MNFALSEATQIIRKMDYEIVKLGKKDLPMYFGFNALRKYCRMSGVTLNELANFGNTMTLDDAVNLIFCGIQEGHRRAKVDFDMTTDGVADLLDGDSEGITRAMELFGEHMGNSFTVKDEKTASGKKQKPKQK